MLRKFRNTFFTAVIFFLVTMPFREFFRVMEISEMRPASALPPVFGMMLGIPGALGCTIGNLAADILSGYSLLVCVLGFIAQFIYGALPLYMWKLIRRFDTNEPPIFRLSNVKNVIRYVVIVLINSVIMAGLLGGIMQSMHFSMLFSTTTLMVLLNNFVFCMVLGIPILIFMSIGKSALLVLPEGYRVITLEDYRMMQEKSAGGRRIQLSLNEQLVLIFLLLGVFSAGLIGVLAYTELSHIISDPITMWNRIYLYIAADQFVFYLITVVFLGYTEKNVAIPVESIAGIAKNYISGGSEKKDSASIVAECERFCRNRNETGILAEAFKTMILDLDTYIDNLTTITAEKERIGAELSVANQIQASMLPCIFPPFPGREEFDIYATMLSAKEVGGDFYDFFFTDTDRLAVVMADVSGKGVPAALFMVIAKTLIKNNACAGKNPKEVFETVNKILCENNDACMFVTAFMGYADLQNGKFVYVNAGHNLPLVKKANGEFEFLKTKPSFAIATFESTVYNMGEITLSPGDTLYLYTDGVTDTVNMDYELFSDARLLETVNRHKNCTAKELLISVKQELDIFAGGAEQADDITMLALKINHFIENGAD